MLELERAGHPGLASADRALPRGLHAQQRRELEGRLVCGELLGVVATDALELGIDIGALDAAICVTFPGTVASLRQMWGRAGRRGRGLAVYVAGEDALDQFFCRHPDEFLDRPVEAAILDHENEQLYAAHLLCAAHEAPLEAADAEVLGPRWREFASVLVGAGDLRERPDGTFVPRRAGGATRRVTCSLRSASRDGVAIVNLDDGEVIGDVDIGPAPSTVHQGAIYLHGGRQFEVSTFDFDQRRALVRPFDGHWYTQVKRETDTCIERVIEERTALGVRLCFGTVVVSEQVLAYQRRRMADNEPIDLIGAGPPAHLVRDPGALVRARRPTISARCTPPSTRRSPCCRCWRCATAGTSAGSPPTGTSRPAVRRSSSTTATRAGSASPAAATTRSSGSSRRLRARQRVPVRVGLPVVRAVAQVRQSQRAAVEGGVRGADGRATAQPTPVARAAGRSGPTPWSPTSR